MDPVQLPCVLWASSTELPANPDQTAKLWGSVLDPVELPHVQDMPAVPAWLACLPVQWPTVEHVDSGWSEQPVDTLFKVMQDTEQSAAAQQTSQKAHNLKEHTREPLACRTNSQDLSCSGDRPRNTHAKLQAFSSGLTSAKDATCPAYGKGSKSVASDTILSDVGGTCTPRGTPVPTPRQSPFKTADLGGTATPCLTPRPAPRQSPFKSAGQLASPDARITPRATFMTRSSCDLRNTACLTPRPRTRHSVEQESLALTAQTAPSWISCLPVNSPCSGFRGVASFP